MADKQRREQEEAALRNIDLQKKSLQMMLR